MSPLSIPTPWRVADVTFVEIGVCNPSERQIRVELEGGVRNGITDASQTSLSEPSWPGGVSR